MNLSERDREVFWHPCGHLPDYVDLPALPVAGASGCRIQLTDGRMLLDAIASWWCKSLGHGHPLIRAAIRHQAEVFEHVITAHLTHAPVVRLCERLLSAANRHPVAAWGRLCATGRLPGHFGKVFLADNGSTGVEVALKLALQGQLQSGRAQRTGFAALAEAYHGETAGALSMSDLGQYKQHYSPLLRDALRLGPMPWRSGPADPRWQDCAAEWPAIERQLDAQASSLAAVVVEPVLLAAAGMRLTSPDLLRRLRAWCSAHEVWLIADEIASGMGRLGAMMACELAGIQPDLAVFSKGLTGGSLPLSAVVVPDALVALFDAPWSAGKSFLHSNTHCGNALACAAANAVFDAYSIEDVLGQVDRRGPALHAGMIELACTRPYLHGVRGAGMMAAADLRRADGTALPRLDRTGWLVMREALARGGLFRPLGDTMYLCPPLNATDADIEQMLAILADSLDAVFG